MDKAERKKTAYQIALIVMSVYFSMLEAMVPKPFPWIKLGFANIATVIGMERFGSIFGIEITILRIFLYGFISGTLMTPGFILSITAGLGSSLVMAGLFSMRKKFSIPAISTAGGFAHNLFQIVTAYFMFFRNIDISTNEVRLFVGVFLIIGTLSGLVIGIVSLRFRLIDKKIETSKKG